MLCVPILERKEVMYPGLQATGLTLREALGTLRGIPIEYQIQEGLVQEGLQVIIPELASEILKM